MAARHCQVEERLFLSNRLPAGSYWAPITVFMDGDPSAAHIQLYAHRDTDSAASSLPGFFARESRARLSLLLSGLSFQVGDEVRDGAIWASQEEPGRLDLTLLGRAAPRVVLARSYGPWGVRVGFLDSDEAVAGVELTVDPSGSARLFLNDPEATTPWSAPPGDRGR